MPKVLETSERSKNDLLKTRYYKASIDKVKNTVKSVLSNMQWTVVGENETYGEITFRSDQYQGTITVYSHNHSESSVDMFLESFSFLGNITGKNKKQLTDFYDSLNKHLTLKGLALNP